MRERATQQRPIAETITNHAFKLLQHLFRREQNILLLRRFQRGRLLFSPRLRYRLFITCSGWLIHWELNGMKASSRRRGLAFIPGIVVKTWRGHQAASIILFLLFLCGGG